MEITIGELFDAIEKNGLRKIKGQFITYDGDDVDTPIAGCALGQAALNLDVSPLDVSEALFKTGYRDLRNMIFYLNDNTERSLPEIARILRGKYSESLEHKIEVDNE